MSNEILEELWRHRDAFAKECNYDLDKMVTRLRELERHSSRPVVNREQEAQEKRADKRSRM